MKKWMLRVLICAALVGVFCLPSLAVGDSEERAVINSGTCGTNLAYTLYSGGELVISGTGAMEYWGAYIENPWYKNRAAITTVTIEDGVTNIGKFAFCYCVALLNITIPDSVTSIGESAFYGCTQLSSVSIPDSVKKIGAYAFEDCKSLASVDFGNGLNTIGSYAFSGCTALTAVTIPSSVTSSYAAFYKCTALTAATIENGVTAIDEVTFYGCSALASVTIPDGVMSIGTDAFFGCPGVWAYGSCGSSLAYVLHNNGELQVTGTGAMTTYSSTTAPWKPYVSSIKTVTIGADVESIGKWTFSGCSSLTAVVIGDSVESIGLSAFYGCSSLTTVTIPDSVKSVGNRAFSGCISLTDVYYNGDVVGWCGISFGKSFANPMCYGDNLYIGGELLTGELVIPVGVTDIPAYAFSNCTGLTSVVIPDSVSNIGDSVFSGCTSLTDAYYNGDVAGWCTISFGNAGASPMYYGDNLYIGGELLTGELVIPEGVTNIPVCAFSNSTGLTSVTIPDSVTSIGGYAFNGCDGLTSMVIPDSVTSIGNHVFQNCSKLTSVTIPKGVTSIESWSFDGCSSLTSVIIPDSVESIGSYALCDCVALTSVTIPVGVTSIGEQAFHNCASLTSVVIPDGVTEIGYDTFRDCTSLSAVTIPDSVESIGEGAFYGCISLSAVTIPDSVGSIGRSAFYGCTALTSMIIPGSVERMDGNVFCGCTALIKFFVNAENRHYKAMDGVLYTADGTELIAYPCGSSHRSFYMPDSVTDVGASAFYNCTTLTSVTLSDNLTSIGYAAFYGCSGLNGMTIPDGVSDVKSTSFNSCSSLAEFVVSPQSAYFSCADGVLYSKDGARLIAYPGGARRTSFSIPNTTTRIEERSFYDCDNLISVTIPDSVASIGYGAFSYCSSLENITIPSSVTSMENAVFSNCNKLRSACVLAQITTFKNFFSYCDSLVTVSMPDTVQIIDEFAFFYCPALSKMVIPEGVTTIRQAAFFGCTSLTSISLPESLSDVGSAAFGNDHPVCVVYYAGTREKWESIDVGGGNDPLLNADIQFEVCAEGSVDAIVWTLNAQGTLHIFGSGAIPAYSDSAPAPWADKADGIVHVVIDSGVTAVGANAFAGCTNLLTVKVPDTVTTINASCLSGSNGAVVCAPEGSAAARFAKAQEKEYFAAEGQLLHFTDPDPVCEEEGTQVAIAVFAANGQMLYSTTDALLIGGTVIADIPNEAYDAMDTAVLFYLDGSWAPVTTQSILRG